MLKNYYQVREWLESFIPYTYSEKNLGLESIKNLLKLLGNPERKFQSILVGGTSGKGSCAFYLARALQYSENSEKSEGQKTQRNQKVRGSEYSEFSGIKVGLHVSPHLIYIGERMQIFSGQRSKVKGQRSERDGPIPVERLVGLINEIRPVVEVIRSKQPHLTPSYFEILVAASFLYFAQEKVDVAVVEVGLGGRLDATNVLDQDLSIITNVGLDHTDILGKTIEEIAREKAGIIKKSKVITGASGKALEVIENVAKEKSAPLITISTLKTSDRAYYDLLRGIKAHIDVVNGGKFQVTDECFFLVNLALNQLGITLLENQQRKVFSACFAARFEEIDDGIIIDGAHNNDKVRVLIKWVQNKVKADSRQQTADSIILVCAFKKGKDWKGMMRLFLTKLDIERVYATQFVTPTDTGFFSSVEPQKIKDFLNVKCQMSNVKCFDNSQEAVWEVLRLCSGSSTLVLITGSLYLAGEARTLWKLPTFA